MLSPCLRSFPLSLRWVSSRELSMIHRHRHHQFAEQLVQIEGVPVLQKAEDMFEDTTSEQRRR